NAMRDVVVWFPVASLATLGISVTDRVVPTGPSPGTCGPVRPPCCRVTFALQNLATGSGRATVTRHAGCAFNLVPVGTYRLEAQVAGFKKFVRRITAELGRCISADLRMEVGGVQEVLELNTDDPVAH